jgi:hypothetical protein
MVLPRRNGLQRTEVSTSYIQLHIHLLYSCHAAYFPLYFAIPSSTWVGTPFVYVNCDDVPSTSLLSAVGFLIYFYSARRLIMDGHLKPAHCIRTLLRNVERSNGVETMRGPVKRVCSLTCRGDDAERQLHSHPSHMIHFPHPSNMHANHHRFRRTGVGTRPQRRSKHWAVFTSHVTTPLFSPNWHCSRTVSCREPCCVVCDVLRCVI